MSTEIILNDKSLQGQFKDTEEFADSINEYTIPILKHIKELGLQLYKSYTTYEDLVTPQQTLADILRISNDPDITMLKSYLIQIMSEEPFWDDSMRTREEVCYKYEGTSIGPCCLTECYERRGTLLSFEHDDFQQDVIVLECDEEQNELRNAYNSNQFLWHGFVEGDLKATYLFPHLKCCKKVQLLEVDGKIYTDEFLNSRDIHKIDRETIKQDLSIMLDEIVENVSSRRWKYVTGTNSYEFRTTISDNRELRLFFSYKKDCFTFYNGYIKKSNTIPKEILKQVKRLEQLVK